METRELSEEWRKRAKERRKAARGANGSYWLGKAEQLEACAAELEHTNGDS